MLFETDIPGTGTVRSIRATETATTYTSTQQTAGFGTGLMTGAPLSVRLVQISALFWNDIFSSAPH